MVSVVIPFWNAAETLSACLKSLRRQTLRHFEAILVDDASTDSSAEIVRREAEKDARFRLFSPGRVGLVGALNLGIATSRTDLIARMDADDLMHPDRLKLQSGYLRDHPEIALVGCRVALFPRQAVRDGYREYVRWQNACIEPDDIEGNLYVESPIAHPSVMVRRSALEAVGGYLDGAFPEDYDLWLRLHHAGFRLAKIPRVLLSWRERSDRTSRVDQRYSRDAFDELRARYLSRDGRLRSGREIVVWGGGRPTRLRVRRLMEEGVQVKAWVDVDPGRIGQTISGLPVHPHTWLDRTPRPFVLVYVTNHGARDEIAGALDRWGYARGRDYLAVG